MQQVVLVDLIAQIIVLDHIHIMEIMDLVDMELIAAHIMHTLETME
jgi:hypothetical protein